MIFFFLKGKKRWRRNQADGAGGERGIGGGGGGGGRGREGSGDGDVVEEKGWGGGRNFA